eukprot:TRINITY_DN5526_c0_g1_i4.p4 TRINITY_DN5526_c0_g1~~TRINITY_DN5526_c0_g1_i4.p4  ORF type:complete len:123 (-),score=8.04 TRINITY_DN5526_c0_g1_i4:169-537(-)
MSRKGVYSASKSLQKDPPIAAIVRTNNVSTVQPNSPLTQTAEKVAPAADFCRESQRPIATAVYLIPISPTLPRSRVAVVVEPRTPKDKGVMIAWPISKTGDRLALAPLALDTRIEHRGAMNV